MDLDRSRSFPYNDVVEMFQFPDRNSVDLDVEAFIELVEADVVSIP